MAMTISGDNGLTFPAGSTQVQAGNYQTMVNRIINGRMEIDQRNAGASITPANGGFGTDRWKFTLSQASKLTSQQSTTAPTGFNNSLLITSSSAYSIGSGDYFAVYQNIEGFNFADCGFGTANAKTVTLSFWVRSSLTGTFGGSLTNSAQNRCYPFSYTISSANTYEYKTVTIAGDTTGTWVGATNGTGASVWFGLGVGSTYSGTAGAWNSTSFCISATGATSVVGTNGATFYITGVDLRVGSYTVVPQDFRAYGTELQLCQRYYWRNSVTEAYGWLGLGTCLSATNARIGIAIGQTMRTSPTVSAGGATRVFDGGTAVSASSFVMNNNSLVYPQLDVTTNSGLTQGRAAFFGANNNAATYLAFDAEL